MDFVDVQARISEAVEWLRLLTETLGALVITVGVLRALVALAGRAFRREDPGFTPVRLLFARHLRLALEFQLASDILSTSVAPTWDRIAKLAAIAVIRTALNYFLDREMRSERAEAERSASGAEASPAGPR